MMQWSQLFLCHLLVWSLAGLIVYPYTLYPLLLWLLNRLFGKEWTREPVTPRLSMIIAAFNEQAIIGEKLANTLALNYPADQLEIVVVSDCSTDRTDAIVAEHAPRVKLVRLEERAGKQLALNRGVEQATGEILVFTDASVLLAPSAVAALARNFADPKVGAVSSVIHLRKPVESDRNATGGGHGHAEKTYLDLDIATRRLECGLGSAVGCCGSCYAVRRSCFVPFAPWVASDFLSALDAVRLGYRVVMDEEAVGSMLPAQSVGGEFRRKVRTIAGGIDTLWQSGAWRSGYGSLLFWWQLMSHKVLRWLGPFALVLMALAVFWGAFQGDRVLQVASVASALAVSLGLLGLAVPSVGKKLRPVRLASFALIGWAAAPCAWMAFLAGRRQVTWSPTKR